MPERNAVRTITIGFAITALFAAVGSGQVPADQGVDRVFHFTYTEKAQDLQEIVNLTRTLADIQRISVDVAQRAVALRASAPQVALADWLFGELDKPANPSAQKTAVYDYRAPDGATSAVRVLYLTHDETQQDLQEIVNLIRTTSDTQRMFAYSPRRAIALLGPPGQVALDEWMFNELNKPASPQTQKAAAYEYLDPRGGADAVRVLYTTHGQSPQNIQEMVNLIRTIADVQRMFPYAAQGAIALRGNAAQVALVEWLFHELDTPDRQAQNPAAYEYRLPSGVIDAVRVYYLTHAGTQQDIQAIASAVRTTASVQRIFPYGAQKALAMRGTDTQIAAAGRLIQELDKPK